MSSFLFQLFLYQPVASVHRLADEAGVVVDGVEIAAATQHDSLVQGVLQPVVGLLGDAVFVGFPGIDQCGAQAMVIQKFGIGIIEGPAAAALHLVGQAAFSSRLPNFEEGGALDVQVWGLRCWNRIWFSPTAWPLPTPYSRLWTPRRKAGRRIPLAKAHPKP